VSAVFSKSLSSIRLITIFVVSLLLSACLPEEKEDTNPTNSDGIEVDDDSLALNGFWNGGLDQTETMRLLIYNGDVYGLDADQAFFGTLESPSLEEVDFALTAFPFSYEDASNNEFVADGNTTSYTINGLLATRTTVVGDYETDGGEFGSITIVNDGTFSNNSSLSSLTGKWTTTDLEMNITSRGRFHGVNNGTNKDCSFEGQFSLLNVGDALLALTINRRNCDDFNGDATGFAAINADGNLEIYSKMGSSLLFMTLNAPTSTGGNTSPDTETPTEEAESP
jgi:hypothetical protein